MTTDKLQIRLPQQLITKLDELIRTGLYTNRSEIIREILRNYFLKNSYNGSLPYIVGPFTIQEMKHFQNLSVDDIAIDLSSIARIKSQINDVDLEKLVEDLWKNYQKDGTPVIGWRNCFNAEREPIFRRSKPNSNPKIQKIPYFQPNNFSMNQSGSNGIKSS